MDTATAASPPVPRSPFAPSTSPHHSSLPHLAMASLPSPAPSASSIKAAVVDAVAAPNPSSSAAGSSLKSFITPPPTPPHAEEWTHVAAGKRQQRELILSQYQQWRPDPARIGSSVDDVTEIVLEKLTANEREIVHLDATEITSRIRARQYTAVEVLTAFVKVTIAAQDATNCITEIFFEEGFARARELDAHLAETGEVVGPLHGLPVSIKDHILVNGHDTSTGYIVWCNETKATKDAVVVVSFSLCLSCSRVVESGQRSRSVLIFRFFAFLSRTFSARRERSCM